MISISSGGCIVGTQGCGFQHQALLFFHLATRNSSLPWHCLLWSDFLMNILSSDSAIKVSSCLMVSLLTGAAIFPDCSQSRSLGRGEGCWRPYDQMALEWLVGPWTLAYDTITRFHFDTVYNDPFYDHTPPTGHKIGGDEGHGIGGSVHVWLNSAEVIFRQNSLIHHLNTQHVIHESCAIMFEVPQCHALVMVGSGKEDQGIMLPREIHRVGHWSMPWQWLKMRSLYNESGQDILDRGFV